MDIFGNIKIENERKEEILRWLREKYLISLFRYPFYAFTKLQCKKEDKENIEKLIKEFPEFYKNNVDEDILQKRYNDWK